MELNGYTITVYQGEVTATPKEGYIVFGPEHHHKIARVYGGTITELTKDSFTRLYDAVDELTKLTEDLFYSWHR